MSSHHLSTPEKKAIESILSEAEHDYSPEDRIEEAVRLLDIESRKIWDDWDDSIALSVVPVNSTNTNNDISEFIQKSRQLIDQNSKEEESFNSRDIRTTKITRISNPINSDSDSNDELFNRSPPQNSYYSKRKSENIRNTTTLNSRKESQVKEFPIDMNSYKQQAKIDKSKSQISRNRATKASLSPPKAKSNNRKSYQNVHEYNEYKKLRRENMEYLNEIKLLENTLMKLNAENDSLKSSINAVKIERAKQKAKIAYLKTENK
ncbi:hypothetical protein TVAG_395460 [Trichomonas vaginalis G3]|uniref:Uncharacterized protein n=1 Tax=Trichomonas vaginalis (strain ATCC PRA-98 / G3) TaxID=412133 RepID=A2F1D5_TRIV3|nr:hypothetical protein TVAGG3_0075590 [Trichomonas vaginalis G3]EAY01299.1 hypothetical protein TVAG_395460 [Trichomonas vaginalis G3]KAI5542829.1 hypothetical protein TVAGG3_0075590 [Trichomonas vaginalis G3]|eukprot:XP_001330167.1 hypothetical protein [Trichomonas vaginalis G3]